MLNKSISAACIAAAVFCIVESLTLPSDIMLIVGCVFLFGGLVSR